MLSLKKDEHLPLFRLPAQDWRGCLSIKERVLEQCAYHTAPDMVEDILGRYKEDSWWDRESFCRGRNLALIAASGNGNTGIVQMLIRNGANVQGRYQGKSMLKHLKHTRSVKFHETALIAAAGIDLYGITISYGYW